MGQNIHAHIEVKHNGVWEHFSAPRVVRDYKLYVLMGSNREVPGLKAIEGVEVGLPADASTITKCCLQLDAALYGQGMVDTVRVLNADGIASLQEAYKAVRPDGCDLEEDVFHCYVAGNAICTHSGFEDSRIIYWFDN